jgi:hypothetical protein
MAGIIAFGSSHVTRLSVTHFADVMSPLRFHLADVDIQIHKAMHVVDSMDRLARNLDDLRQIVKKLTGKGIRVEFIKEVLVFTGDDSPMDTLPLPYSYDQFLEQEKGVK